MNVLVVPAVVLPLELLGAHEGVHRTGLRLKPGIGQQKVSGHRPYMRKG